ncbi:hypothetical protein GCM10028791_36490 [Echinicola sediminis]
MFALSSFGQADDGFKRTLKKMLEVSGSEEVFKTSVTQMFAMFKQQNPNVQIEKWDELEKAYLKTSMDELVEMLVPVYRKYLSEEELQELINFYNTPAGKKFAQSSPLIMKESMQIGQQWGMKIAQEVMQKLEESE